MIKALATGSILQLMFLKRRLKKMKPGKFLEFGLGEGIFQTSCYNRVGQVKQLIKIQHHAKGTNY